MANLLLLLSPPRAGSTFVQRLLATDPGVVSPSETWAFPMVLAGFSDERVVAEFGFARGRAALDNFQRFAEENGADLEQNLIRAVIQSMCSAVPPHASTFVEKTPRTSLHGAKILAADDDVKALVLVRNPIDVVLSVSRSWREGHWILLNNEGFVVNCYRALAEVVERFPERTLVARYEELHTTWDEFQRQLGERFDIAVDVEALRDESEFTFDDTRYRGSRLRQSRQFAPQERNTDDLSSRVRQRDLRRILRRIGAGPLASLGYPLDTLEAELDVPTRVGATLRDLPDSAMNRAIRFSDPRLQRRRLREGIGLLS